MFVIFQVGVITYSDESRLDIKLNEYSDKQALMDAISRITYVPGNTNISGGLWRMREVLYSEENGARPGYPKVGLLISDGEATVDAQLVTTEANRVRQDGISMVVIGIGGWIRRSVRYEVISLCIQFLLL